MLNDYVMTWESYWKKYGESVEFEFSLELFPDSLFV